LVFLAKIERPIWRMVFIECPICVGSASDSANFEDSFSESASGLKVGADIALS